MVKLIVKSRVFQQSESSIRSIYSTHYSENYQDSFDRYIRVMRQCFYIRLMQTDVTGVKRDAQTHKMHHKSYTDTNFDSPAFTIVADLCLRASLLVEKNKI
jgi:hypothetical protein